MLTTRLGWRELWWLLRFFGRNTQQSFKTFIAHDGVFNTQSMFGQQGSFLQQLGFGTVLGKRQC
jgi:hypothetical protein